jgi:hypothetical protein
MPKVAGPLPWLENKETVDVTATKNRTGSDIVLVDAWLRGNIERFKYSEGVQSDDVAVVHETEGGGADALKLGHLWEAVVGREDRNRTRILESMEKCARVRECAVSNRTLK